MGRDDLCVTVPAYFRCPISLDVMKSPVSLSTGVTYDRASIQRWLDDGHDTCPATMQLLPSKDLVPNRTLHRLIQIWSAQNNPGTHTTITTSSAAEKCHVAELIQRMDRTRFSVDSLMKILRFGEKSEENRKLLAGNERLPAILTEALAGERNFSILEIIVRIVSILIGDERVMRMMMTRKSGGDYVSSLLLVLQQGSLDSRIASVRVLESMAGIAEVKATITEREEALLPELLKLTSSPVKDSALIEGGLSCLIAVSVPKRVKVKLIHLGAVKAFSKLLSDSKSTTAMIEKVLKLLEMVSSVKEGRAKICETAEKEGGECCVSAIMKRLLKVSTTATEHAVTILWSVCCLFKERSAAEAAVKANGLTKILLLMQSNCSPCVRQMAADLLKIFRVNSKSVIACYDTNSYYALLKNS